MKIKNKSRPYLILIPKNQEGQAIIEYVLAMTVSVILVLSLMAYIFKPFGDFVKDSMGGYTRCLLETGEVPRLGGPTNIKEETDCFAQMKKGQMPAGGGPTGSTSSTSKNSSSAVGSTAANDSGGGGGGSGGGGSGPSGGFRSFSGSSRTGDGGSFSSDKVTQVPVRELSNSGTFKSSGESVWALPTQASKKVNIGAGALTDAQKEEIAKKNLSGKLKSVDSGALAPKAKKIAVKPPPERKVAEVDADSGFDLGNIIRVIFIILIILVLLIVLGGQGYKLFKSWEK